jgi:signal transduction histidine kinase
MSSRPSGLPAIGAVPWGTHLCQFYRTSEDLLDSLVPYFRAGLENNELCVWVTSEPLRAEQAWASLRRQVPDLDAFIKKDQIRIVDFEDWYAPGGKPDVEASLAAWREREEQAILQGFDGLRWNGNTFWLPSQDWQELARYEAMVHESSHGRRILALCSYSLERCGADELADVLRNHKFALVKQAGEWEVFHNATLLLAAVSSGDRAASARASARHELQFYEERTFLASRVADYAKDGLDQGEGVLLISDQSRSPLAVDALRARGVAADSYRESGQLGTYDARQLLAGFMVDGKPDPARFVATIKPLLERMAAAYARVRIYGEMVNVLLMEGNAPAAVELERLWNALLAGRPITLLCGYELAGLDRAVVVRHLTAAHDSIHPAESLSDFDNVVETGRLIGELHQKAHLLKSEAQARLQLELERIELLVAEQGARARADLATEHLARLQTVTAALSEAATPLDIGRVIVTEMAKAAEAERAILAVPVEDGAMLELLGHAGLASEAAVDFARFPTAAALPVAVAFRTGKAVWLPSRADIEAEFPALRAESRAMACLPLAMGAKRLGAIGFGYRQPREFTATDRALLHDLTKQASLALDRSLLLQQAEQANRAKDEFLAMLGHELRNPLSPIVNSLQIMRLRGGEAKFGREVEVIERQVRNLVRLVDDLLDVSRITQGRVSLEKEVVETAEVVARAIELARPLIEQRAHRLQVEITPEGLALEADTSRLAQVLSNLLINAAKYTEPGGRISVAAGLNSGEIEIRVRDNGPGIPPSLMPRLFDLFVQGSPTLDRRQGGLGIGLSVAKSLVELHRGRLSAHSDGPGQGSEFVVRLPRWADSRDPAATPTDAAGQSPDAPGMS